MRSGWAGVCVLVGVCVACGSTTRPGTGGRGGSGNMGTGGNSTGPTLIAGLAESTLTAGIALPNEGPELDDPAVDESITLTEPAAASDEPVAISPGDVITVEIPFEAPEGNVVAAGIRFGEQGPIRQIEIPEAEGDTSNTLRFQFEVPPDICDDLAQICHDITCYEFAVTDIGEISAANIMQLGLVCGDGCNEPTCQTLLMCEMPAEPDAGEPMVDPMTPSDNCLYAAEDCSVGTNEFQACIDSQCVDCQTSEDCPTYPPSNWGEHHVCNAGTCVWCTEDADCGEGQVCREEYGECLIEYCDLYTVVPVAELNQPCTCPEVVPGETNTDCTDSPDCAGGRCYGLQCVQACGPAINDRYCSSICGEFGCYVNGTCYTY
ncbi:MAG TPA: hypothetical protein VHO25_10220 [Polyangiaceae bacterium]|nr:hypothetical protein [Polyangiaceae bacterium]